ANSVRDYFLGHLHTTFFIGLGFSFALFAFFTVQQHSEFFFAPLLGHHPRTVLPWRGMPYMLVMSAGQLCNPMLFFIQMKTDNGLLHGIPPVSSICLSTVLKTYINKSCKITINKRIHSSYTPCQVIF